MGLSLQVAINLSAAQLETLECLDHLASNLHEFSLPPEKIVLEITESLPMSFTEDVTARLIQLKTAGLDISADDFGTRYTSVEQLARIPVTEIKLDKSLVQDPDASISKLRSVVDQAHPQGIRVVAEGIETQGQLTLVRTAGCDRGQGFLFGRPMPADVITALLLEESP
jgi:EAL domain-containing protein (putative c-di-GMP-specific phosphodiesterase class I)